MDNKELFVFDPSYPFAITTLTFFKTKAKLFY